MQRKVKIGLAGFGTVGYGVYTTLRDNAEEIERRLGASFRITRVVCRNLDRARKKAPEADFVFSNDLGSLVSDPEVDIVVELMGGVDAAKTLISQALNAGKRVVTANKHLLATCGNELFELARENHVTVAYEAAVAGGIPIIKALREGLSATRVRSVAGIVNGTCNYILTRMQKESIPFSDALAAAQKLGYAESDPTLDIEGFDSAHKISILSALAFQTPIAFKNAHIEGISRLKSRDVELAKTLGYNVKLIALADRATKGIEVSVAPRLVKEKTLLGQVEGVMNAVEVDCEGSGKTLYYGAGAGERPTASAVVADLIDLVRNNQTPMPGVVQFDSAACYVEADKVESAFYVRIDSAKEEDLASFFAKHSLSIQERKEADKEVLLITDKISWNTMDVLKEEFPSISVIAML